MNWENERESEEKKEGREEVSRGPDSRVCPARLTGKKERDVSSPVSLGEVLIPIQR